MPKLFTLGCSLTYPHGWKDILAEKLDYTLVNSAMYASSNNLQVRRIHSYIVNGQLSNDDIIVWQITGQERSSFSLPPDPIWKKRLDDFDRNPDPNWSNCKYYMDAPTNYFDNKTHTDVLSNHPIIVKSSNYYDSMQSLEELLSTIILLNNSYQILIFVGWDGALNDVHPTYDKFIQALEDNSVPHIKDSMLTWAIKNDWPLDDEDPQGLHPKMETNEAYAEHVLYPKLQGLGWI